MVRRMQDRTKHVLKLLSGKCLDVGCGKGEVTIEGSHDGLDIIGTDISATNIDFCNERAEQHHKYHKTKTDNPKFLVSDLFDMPFNPKSFDTIYLGHVLEHMTAPELAIKRILPFLKDDGNFIISVPAGFAHYDPDHSFFFFDDDTLTNMIKHWFHYMIPPVIKNHFNMVGIKTFMNKIPGIEFEIDKVEFSDSRYPSMDLFVTIKRKNPKEHNIKVKLDWSAFPTEMDVPEGTTDIHIPLMSGDVQIGPENKKFTIVDPSMSLLFQQSDVDKDGTLIFKCTKGVKG